MRWSENLNKKIIRIWVVIRKDIIDLLRSKTVVLSLSLPIVLSILFNITFSKLQITLGVYSPSNLPIWCQDWKDNEYIKVFPLFSKEEGYRLLNSGKLKAMLIFPSEFDRRLSLGKKTDVVVVIDNTAWMEASLVKTFLLEMWQFHSKNEELVNIIINPIHKYTLNPKQAILPIWILLTIFGSLMIISSSFMEEKEKKTLLALTLAGVTPLELVTAKVVVGMIMAVGGCCILLILNGGLDVERGKMFLLLIVNSWSWIMIGILVAIYSPSHITANTWNSLLMLVMVLPVALADSSYLMFAIARFLPSFYTVASLRELMLKELNFDKFLLYFLFIFGWGIIVGAIIDLKLKKLENLG